MSIFNQIVFARGWMEYVEISMSFNRRDTTKGLQCFQHAIALCARIIGAILKADFSNASTRKLGVFFCPCYPPFALRDAKTRLSIQASIARLSQPTARLESEKLGGNSPRLISE